MKKALMGMAAMAAAFACQAAPYGVVTLGVAKQGGACDDVSTSCDDTSTGFKILGGYTFTPNLAAEGGYFNFGKSKLDDGLGNTASAKVDAFGVGGAYTLDFTPEFSGVARLGIAAVKLKLDANVSGFGTFSDDESHTRPYWGLGIGYKVAPNLSINASYDGTRVKTDAGGTANLSLLGIGATMSF